MSLFATPLLSRWDRLRLRILPRRRETLDARLYLMINHLPHPRAGDQQLSLLSDLGKGAGWVGAGYDGVHVFSPDGTRIGMIVLPEGCANVCFGGSKRNRLFMAASQSIYAVYVETTGAHIA